MASDFRIPYALVLTVLDVDPDYLLVEVIAGDGAFAGRAQVYESVDLATSLAKQLAGFPRSPSDRRDVVLGSFDPGHAGGALQLQMECVDRSGHVQVRVRLFDQPMTDEASRSAEFALPIEATAVDTFVSALARWGPTRGDVALCAGAA